MKQQCVDWRRCGQTSPLLFCDWEMVTVVMLVGWKFLAIYSNRLGVSRVGSVVLGSGLVGLGLYAGLSGAQVSRQMFRQKCRTAYGCMLLTVCCWS